MATSDLVAGERALLSLGTHCGVRVLSRLINDRVWRTNEGAGEIDWIPPEWHVDESRPDGPIVVEALLAADGESITVSKGGRSVVYLAGGSGFEERDLCS